MVVHIDPSRFNRTCPRCGANVHGLSASHCPECGGSTTPSCVGCGYDLAGLPRDGSCPECGTPVERSYAPDLLENRSPAYLRELLFGLDLVMWGTICGIVLIALLIPVLIVLEGFQSGTGATEVAELAGGVLALACSGAVFLGWWKITTPDPTRAGTDLDVAPRRVVRVTLVIQIAAEVLSLATEAVSLSSGTGGAHAIGVVVFAADVVSSVAWAVQFFAAVLYVRWLARRVPDPEIERRARQLMWLGPLLFVLGLPCLGIGPLVALILYLVLINTLRQRVRVIALAAAA